MTEFLLLFFVFVGELGLAAVVYLSNAITKEHTLAVFFAVYILQFFTSTIQGGVSDHSLRKKSLLVAFNAVFIAQIFFLLAFKYPIMLIGAVIFYGFLGNITPIARGALADTELRSNFRLSMGLSTNAIALGWVLMAFASFYLSPLIGCILVTVLCFGCNFLVRYIKDPEDKPLHETFSLKNELSVIKSLFKHSEIFWGMLGYLIAEVAFYQIFARGKGEVNDPRVRFIITTWVGGYVLGAVSQHYIFRKKQEKLGIIWGAGISIAAMIFLIFFTIFGVNGKALLAITNGSFALGFGFFIPCVFSIVSERYPLHLQGKIYGLIDAVDSLALMIAVGINHLPFEFNLVTLMTSSLVFSVGALYCFFMTIKCAGKKSVPRKN